MTPTLLKDILIIFLVSIPVVLLLKKFHVPMVVGFLVTGALIGQGGFELISNAAHIDLLAELGLTLLLFSVGLEFSFENFSHVTARALVLAFAQVILTTASGTLMGILAGWPLGRSLYLGCVLALSSTAVVMTILHDKRMHESVPGKIANTVLIIQDLAFIPMIILLPVFAPKASGAPVLLSVLVEKALALLILAAVVFLGRLFINRVMRMVSTLGQRPMFVITVMIIGLGLSWLTSLMGLPFALGAFVGGLLIGFTGYRYQALSEVTPFRYCFNSLFFVSIGMLVNFEFLRNHFIAVFLLVLTIPVIKLLLVMIVMALLRFPVRVALITGLCLAQVGEFSFLLVHHGQKAGVLSSGLHDLLIASAVASMIITPLLILNAHRITAFITKVFKQTGHDPSTALAANTNGLENHVIICGFGPLGQTFATFLSKHKVPYIVLELNPKTIQRIKRGDTPALYGDGTSEHILYKSRIEHARLMAITVPDFLDNSAIIKQTRLMNPDIQIITRAKFRNDVDKLYEAGANVVISEELEGGIEMGRFALELVGIEANEVNGFINQIRDYGSADFFG